MKITKKFYVGSATVAESDWCHKTLEAAIKHAKQQAEETETNQIVVQIIRIVRIPKLNPIVEKV